MKMRNILVGTAAAISILAVAQSQLTMTYWFDGDSGNTVPVSNGESSIEVDASSLKAGVHTLFAMVNGENGLSSARSALFVKVANPVTFPTKAFVSINGEESSTVQVTPTAGGAGFTIDVSKLPLGIHSLTTALVSEKEEISEFKNGLFLRVPTTAEINSMKAFYSIDGGESRQIPLAGNLPLYNLNIDASDLTSGIHSVSLFLASPLGMATTPIKSYFVKIPMGGEGIKEIRYWIDDDEANAIKQTPESTGLPFSLIKMIDVPLADFRSSSYELKIEEGNPVVYGVHDLNFFAFDTDNRPVNYSRAFTESRLRKEVKVTETLQGDGKPVALSKLAKNEIKWYDAQANLGDSLTVKLSNSATIDVFSPSGKLMYSAKGNEAVSLKGFYATETGKYLFGVHDCANANYAPSLTYTHIDKYAIIDRSPRQTAEGSMFVLNISGNGFDHLKEVKLTSDSKEFVANNILKEGNGKAKCIFDLTDAPLTDYKLIANYDDGEEKGTVEIDNALKVVKARKGEIKVSAARSVFGTTLNDVLIKVTNTGNIPYWGIPFNLAAEADGTESIKLNFKDFIPTLPEGGPEDWKMYFTDNLLGTGRRGGYLPMMIPYIGPGETKEFTIVYQMPLRTHIPTYVWCGRPWSDEFSEILQLAEEGKAAVPQDVNYISASLVNMILQLQKFNNGFIQSSKGQMRAPAHPVDISDYTDASEAIQAVGEYFGHDMSSLNNATTAAQYAVAIGNTTAGIYNGLRVNDLDMRVDCYGIDLRDETFSSLANYRSDLVGSMPSPGDILRRSGWDIAGMLLDNWLGRRAQVPNPMPDVADIVQMTPCDPNDIIGYQDPSGGRFVGIDVKSIPYTIEFENDPDLATAPAHVIKVTDVLDPEVFDLDSFAMREIKIGKKSMKFDGGADFIKTIDMRPEINSVAEVSMTLDKSTGEATWTLRSLDPMTLETAEEMIQGILPVNMDGDGCGEILFDINLRPGLSDASEFSNKASIIFDSNDAIETPVWKNVIDLSKPYARIVNVTTEDNKTFTLDIESNDKGAGVWHYELYYRPNGSEEFELLRGAIPAEERTLTFDRELDGYFVAIAIDGAGNRQAESAASILWGDADANGIVDSNDVVVIRNFFVGKTGAIDKTAAEVTSDYIIDAQDALVTRNIFLKAELKKTQHFRTRKYSKRK